MSSDVAVRARVGAHLRAPWSGFLLWLFTWQSLALFILMSNALSLLSVGIGILLVPWAVVLVRKGMSHHRRMIARYTGRRIEDPYLPPAADEAGESGFTLTLRRFQRMIVDPATWRDLLFLSLDQVVAGVTALLPSALVVYGAWGWVLSAGAGREIGDAGGNSWYTFVHVDEHYGTGADMIMTAAMGTVILALGFLIGPKLLDAYGRWGQTLLGPTEKSRLALRVQHLTETRTDAVDASAAELRRIERDLHDGAQARLVAMGMTLGAIEHLLDKDPAKARLLLSETRASSAKALGELRDLVRGIHPPVLADRGIGDAVRALALDHPLPVEVHVALPGRPEPPVESAVYFAIAEILTNTAKHSGADRVWVELRYDGGMLRATVTDDGRGGASLDGGTGLRGIERRIGTFDGVLALSSPLGGPTIVTLELPCTIT